MASHEPISLAVLQILILGHGALKCTLYQSYLDQQFLPSHTEISARMIPDSPAAVKYHSYLITFLPHHPVKFIAKCREIHYALLLQYL